MHAYPNRFRSDGFNSSRLFGTIDWRRLPFSIVTLVMMMRTCRQLVMYNSVSDPDLGLTLLIKMASTLKSDKSTGNIRLMDAHQIPTGFARYRQCICRLDCSGIGLSPWTTTPPERFMASEQSTGNVVVSFTGSVMGAFPMGGVIAQAIVPKRLQSSNCSIEWTAEKRQVNKA